MRRNSATLIFPFSRTYRSRKDSAPNSASSFSVCSTASTWRQRYHRRPVRTEQRHRRRLLRLAGIGPGEPFNMQLALKILFRWGALSPQAFRSSEEWRRNALLGTAASSLLLAAIAIPLCAQRARRPKTGRASLFRGYSNSFKVRAMAWRRSSISARTVPGSNFPSPFFFPAAIPVRSSMPCSTLPTGQT